MSSTEADSPERADYAREHQICELIFKIQLRLESALDRLLECQRKQASLLRIERMDIRADLNLTRNEQISKTRLRLQNKIKEQTRRAFTQEDASGFDIAEEKDKLEAQAQTLRREIEMLKSKADSWKLQLKL